ncbi:MAG: polysaccharide deacetylase family protein [Burkholderiales bacterium]
MARHLVCMTFDFDAMSGFIARGMTSPTPISRGEFGAVAVPRILRLLNELHVPATFFIPGHTLATYPNESRMIADAGCEIGHHGWTHRPPATLTRDEEEAELVRANELIKSLTGSNARGYRSPSWDLSSHSVELLLQHGFVYDSSMMGHDYCPYRVRRNDVITLEAPAVFGERTRLIEMPVSWSLDDYPHFEFVRTRESILPGLQNANQVLDNWLNEFEYMRRITDWGVLTYTFHPFVIGRGHRMLMLEKLVQRLADSGANFTTLADAATEYARRDPLQPDA